MTYAVRLFSCPRWGANGAWFLIGKWILARPAVASELRTEWCGLPGWFHIVLGGIGWAAVQAVRNLSEASLLPTSRLRLTSISEATSDEPKQNGDSAPMLKPGRRFPKLCTKSLQLPLTDKSAGQYYCPKSLCHTIILKLPSGFVRLV